MQAHQNIPISENHSNNVEIITKLNKKQTSLQFTHLIVKINQFIGKDIHNMNQDLGAFYCLNKNFHYQQKIVLFILLDYLISNHLKINQKIKNQCLKIQKVFKDLLVVFNKKINKQTPENLQKIYGENFNEIVKFQFKINTIFSQIKQKQFLINLTNSFNNRQIELILNIFLDCWKSYNQFKVNLSSNKNQFFNSMQEILSGKIEIKISKNTLKIVKLKIFKEDSSSQTHFLYKNINILLNKRVIADIIETNQEKSVYFKTYSIGYQRALKKKRISQLFRETDPCELNESQQSIQDSQNSEIIQDEDFFRISSKISNSQRKNSFNSGQILVPEQIEKRRLSQQNNERMSKPQKSSIILTYPSAISKTYSRSNSAYNNTLFNRNYLYTSIDLLLKNQTQKLKDYREQNCKNSSITKTTESDMKLSKFQERLPKIQFNVFDETHSKRFEQLYIGEQPKISNCRSFNK